MLHYNNKRVLVIAFASLVAPKRALGDEYKLTYFKLTFLAVKPSSLTEQRTNLTALLMKCCVFNILNQY